jgi:hypothetical protein
VLELNEQLWCKSNFQILKFACLSDPGDRRWVGMWWGGFLLCGLLLILVAIPFYAFPKTLQVRVKFEIHVLVKMMMLFFVAMSFGLLDRYQCFIETYCFTSHSVLKKNSVSSKNW